MDVHVVKLGGSVLARRDWDCRLQTWLTTQPNALRLFITGGGAWADMIRRMDHVLELPSEIGHQLAIASMAVTMRVVQQRLGWPIISNWPDVVQMVKSRNSPCNRLVCVDDFLQHVEPNLPGAKLPIGWASTSDSIAARACQALCGKRLILLKSATPPWPRTRAVACEQGYVDAAFASAAAKIPEVECVDTSQNAPLTVPLA